jgi:cellulose biosynthesis protein BcsQ
MKKKFMLLQAKGGSAKTTLAKVVSLYFSRSDEPVTIVDLDNSTPALTHWLNQIPKEKRKNFTCSSFNLLSPENNIDRSLIDLYLSEISKDENSVSDFGAAESSAFLYWLQEEQKNGIVDTLKEAGVLLLIVLTGAFRQKSAMTLLSRLWK